MTPVMKMRTNSRRSTGVSFAQRLNRPIFVARTLAMSGRHYIAGRRNGCCSLLHKNLHRRVRSRSMRRGKMVTTHRRRRRLTLAALALIGCAAVSSVAHAQDDLDRFQRQLERIRRDTILEVDPNVPLGQRTFVDYGAYITVGYLSLDDNVDENHVLGQYEIFPYFRLNVDGAHEFFLRGRVGWRDFNEGDSFDGRGDERIDPDLDAGYYRFDLARSRAAYEGEQLDYNVI